MSGAEQLPIHISNLDTFRGDNDLLISSIHALVELDKEGALVPHGIGGHARGLLESAAIRLAALEYERKKAHEEPLVGEQIPSSASALTSDSLGRHGPTINDGSMQ